MSRKLETVRSLARSADLDLDEALIALWDSGFDWVKGPNDRFPAREINRARQVLGLSNAQVQTRVSWWMQHTGLTFDELSIRSSDMGFNLIPGARRLPKGALKKFIVAFPDNAQRVERQTEIEISQPSEAFEIEHVGSVAPRRYLNEENVELIHQALTLDAHNGPDPIFPPGIKSHNLLSSALTRPQTQFSDQQKYQTVELAGAALLHSIIQNHPFFNGNKRTGFVSLLLFLEQNDYDFDCDEDEIFKFLMRVSSHSLVPDVDDSTLSDREVVQIAHWIREHVHTVEPGERIMSWIKFQALLRSHSCDFQMRRGSKIEIRRLVSSIREGGREELLKTKVPYGGDGREVQRDTVQKIRRDLKLDGDNGIDNYSFYGGKPINSIIKKYRGILRRLGKV